ncbi:hypothetical protein QW131_17425 [Roseibium salinum]|nr:hypothetical protein [Roseibium salinum]
MLERPASEISTKENQTFLYLLSICLLHRKFVQRQGLSEPILPPLEKAVNLAETGGAYASQGNFNSVT